jgi:NADH:ubiquinone oxidoreductase subunit 2 (subunit N)
MITGEIKINGIEEYIKIGNEDKVLMIGIIFIMVALLFKIAAGPFHM